MDSGEPHYDASMDTSEHDADSPSEESPPPPRPARADWRWPAYPSQPQARDDEPETPPDPPTAPPDRAEPPPAGQAPPGEQAPREEAPASAGGGALGPAAAPTQAPAPVGDAILPIPAVQPVTHAGPPTPAAPPPWTAPATPEPGWGAPPAWGAPAGWGPPPAEPARRRRRGWIIALALLATVALAVGSLVGLGPTLRQWASESADTGPAGRPAATSPPKLRVTTPGRDPGAALRSLLAARVGAVLHHDRAAFLATVDRRRGTFYRAQAALFDHMATVPFAAIKYQAGRDLATERVRRRYAPSRVYLSEVRASYRFRGQDSAPVTAHYSYTFTLTSAGWRVAGQGDLSTRKDDVEIWDAGPVGTVHSARTLVVYHPGERPLAERLLAAAERGYGQVDASWSASWDHKVVVLVPHDQKEAERLVRGRDLSDVAAVASSQVEQGPLHRLLGNRVIVNTSMIRRYKGLNLQIVVTHEMTHVATRNVGVAVPLFLVEGFADYTALRSIDAPLRVTRPALAAGVRSGRFKGRLPSDGDLLGDDAALAYDEASSFCLWLARTYGEAKVQSLYRSFAYEDVPTPEERDPLLDIHLWRVLGTSRAAAESRWAAFVRRAL